MTHGASLGHKLLGRAHLNWNSWVIAGIIVFLLTFMGYVIVIPCCCTSKGGGEIRREQTVGAVHFVHASPYTTPKLLLHTCPPLAIV